MKKQFKNVDEYISSFPPEVQTILEKIRQTVRRAAPEAVESISYQMPAFKLDGKRLVYFAGFKNHIGFYPLPSGIESLGKETAPYKTGRGTLQFPLKQPIPYDLIEKIVRFRVKENRGLKSGD